MPKTRTRSKVKGNKSISKRVAFKIGGRKSETSTLSMSNYELKKAYLSKSTRRRDIKKIGDVLCHRGIDLDTIIVEDEAA